MTTKKKETMEESPFYFLGDIIKRIFDGAINTFFSSVREDIKHAVDTAQRRFLKSFQQIVFFVAGVVFILIATIQLIPEYTGIDKGWLYLIAGVLLLLVANLKNQA
jgi:hypothetical protein